MVTRVVLKVLKLHSLTARAILRTFITSLVLINPEMHSRSYDFLYKLELWLSFSQGKILSQELEVERKRFPPLEDRIVKLESDLAAQEDRSRLVKFLVCDKLELLVLIRLKTFANYGTLLWYCVLFCFIIVLHLGVQMSLTTTTTRIIIIIVIVINNNILIYNDSNNNNIHFM